MNAAILSLLLAAVPEQQALIWGGGTTETAARAVMPDVAKLPVTLGAGFPKLVKSDQLPGLKPGFFVVILGFCPKKNEVLAALKSANAGTYERTVRSPEPYAPDACPKLRSLPLAIDVVAIVAGGGEVQYQGYTPGSCNDPPVAISALEVSVSGGKPNTTVEIELHATTETTSNEDGVTECDSSKVSLSDSAKVKIDAKLRARHRFRFGQWPCEIKVVVNDDKGRPLADRRMGVGDCAE